MLKYKILLIFLTATIQANQTNDISLQSLAEAISLLQTDLSLVQNENVKIAQELSTLKEHVHQLNIVKYEQDVNEDFVIKPFNKSGIQEDDIEERLEKLLFLCIVTLMMMEDL